MPDVDACCRIAERGLCGNFEECANMIYHLNDKNKVTFFRSKSQDKIANDLKQFSHIIESEIWQKFYKNNFYKSIRNELILAQDSNNNKIGADLYHILPNGKIISIEVKFGQKTDRNIGMPVFDKIFGCSYFSNALSRSQRANWKDLFIKNLKTHSQSLCEEIQLGYLYDCLNVAITKFNNFQKAKNNYLTNEEQKYMEDIILNVSGDASKKYDYYMKFIVDGSKFQNVKSIQTGIGQWYICEVEDLSVVKRVNVYIKNFQTNTQIKFTLNWKNNYEILPSVKVSAKCGLGSSNWNVWVTVEISKISF